ncbi:MAG: AIPR family protein [Terriglobales bacterium]
MPKLQLSYPGILQQFGTHAVKERTESRALLAWFLENYYRLDEMEVSDCICDGRYDKGIDGIYVNDQLGQIDVFQTVIVQTEKGLGDTGLKEFAGSLSQFKDKASVENLIKTSKNPALTSLLKSNEIARKVEEGFAVQGVFISNALRDQNAKDFLAAHPSITLYDRDELERSYSPLDKTAPIAKEMSFDIGSVPHMVYQLSAKVQMVIASLSAEDLVNMDGIANGELFAWNVRQFLGRKTKVNKDIARSIKSSPEHNLFPAFHNGLTILCEKLDAKKDKITIGGYAVVNGCQSLSTLYENKKDITKELRIITKFINVPPNDALATKITDHTNNQNGTTFRDLQSNNPIQVRLQSEIHRKYKNDAWFRIKRGEHLEWPADKTIENERAARVLLAFDLRDPSSCHQTYKLFDELHANIFGRPGVDADRIVLANDIYNLVVAQLDSMTNNLFGKYGLTRYLIIYLLREALETDDVGKELCKHPSKFLAEPNGRKRLNDVLGKVVDLPPEN